MLFRVVAPVDTVKQVLRDVGTGQSMFTQGEILDRLLAPESGKVLTLETSREKWEKLLVDAQATPAEISRGYHKHYPYLDKDVIWLSSLEPGVVLMSAAEFDLFIHEE